MNFQAPLFGLIFHEECLASESFELALFENSGVTLKVSCMYLSFLGSLDRACGKCKVQFVRSFRQTTREAELGAGGIFEMKAI